jgi:hypothetical protein
VKELDYENIVQLEIDHHKPTLDFDKIDSNNFVANNYLDDVVEDNNSNLVGENNSNVGEKNYYKLDNDIVDVLKTVVLQPAVIEDSSPSDEKLELDETIYYCLLHL